MLRLLIFFAVIAAAAFGLAWLADNPGVVTLLGAASSTRPR